MSAVLEEILGKARDLPRPEKAKLARILIDDLDDEPDEDVEALWIVEVRRRYDLYKKGKMEALDGDEVMARLRSRFK